MKFLICIPVDLALEDTRRATIKNAGKNKLLDMVRNPEETSKVLRAHLDAGTFIVRAPEAPAKAE